MILVMNGVVVSGSMYDWDGCGDDMMAIVMRMMILMMMIMTTPNAMIIIMLLAITTKRIMYDWLFVYLPMIFVLRWSCRIVIWVVRLNAVVAATHSVNTSISTPLDLRVQSGRSFKRSSQIPCIAMSWSWLLASMMMSISFISLTRIHISMLLIISHLSIE